MTTPKAPSPRLVSCPHCGKSVLWTPESRFRPFCSERCKLIDIGAWASGAYVVPGQETPLPDEERE
ncbi:DNA gyrase inhibitor YacG [Uliginosibacterium sp. 31-16]|uniref:DNA gyrase inhibitor YacG n=1 Tax=Uliginosibacterium sp. 31-16 TaxID=3068315 RepID=UPI00273EC2F6|nr:DNA gyrase inhibitor YacG [Uliginosibacterium sp. 31-16]MDP5238455.1 DNA gyrase inhibitor YacG [Uliginosibacterium sp. 31-16]